MNVEDNRHVYEGKDAFLRLPTSFSKSVRYKMPLFAGLTINNAIGVQGRVAICRYLVSLAIGVTYDCQIQRCEWTSLCCSSFFSFVRMPFSNILSAYYSTWAIYVNVTILWNYIAETATHVQAIDTRPSFSSHVAWIQGCPCPVYIKDCSCWWFVQLSSNILVTQVRFNSMHLPFSFIHFTTCCVLAGKIKTMRKLLHSSKDH